MAASETIELVVSWATSTALTFAVVLFDERGLDGERLARAWPPSSRDAAIVMFGPLALPLHFARTRGELGSARGLVRVVIGLAAGLALAFGVALVAGLAAEVADILR